MRRKAEKMKVVQVNTVANGCTGRIACSLHTVLEKNGNSSVIAYGRGRCQSNIKSYKISNFFDSDLHGLMTRIFDTCGLHSKIATRKFIKWLDKNKPDILHLHNLHGYYINYPMLFSYIKSNNIKTFWTLHDCWAFTGHCPYYTYAQCEKWKTQCYECKQKKHHPTSYIFDGSEKNYAIKRNAFTNVEGLTIITPSLWLKEQVQKSFLQDYKVEHIPNGISLQVFCPTENEFRTKNNLEEKVIVLGVANLWAETKGLRYFFELAQVLPDYYQIVLVGLSKQQLETLPSNIIGLKKTDNIQELVDIYSSADVFVNPTLEDNFPTTNIEALACGTPVVTFNTGGSPEAIDSTCGMIVEKNVLQIREACLKIGRKNDEMVLACLRRAKEFDENTCYGKYISMYQRQCK